MITCLYIYIVRRKERRKKRGGYTIGGAGERYFLGWYKGDMPNKKENIGWYKGDMPNKKENIQKEWNKKFG